MFIRSLGHMLAPHVVFVFVPQSYTILFEIVFIRTWFTNCKINIIHVLVGGWRLDAEKRAILQQDQWRTFRVLHIFSLIDRRTNSAQIYFSHLSQLIDQLIELLPLLLLYLSPDHDLNNLQGPWTIISDRADSVTKSCETNQLINQNPWRRG